jgi:hypothetical protein
MENGMKVERQEGRPTQKEQDGQPDQDSLAHQLDW